jgi:hypothetical protein
LGARAEALATVQATMAGAVMPPSSADPLTCCVRNDCDSPSQTFRQAAFAWPATPSWLAIAPAWPADTTDFAAAARGPTALACVWVPRDSSKQASAHAVEIANNHTSSTVKAVTRLERACEKGFIGR